MWTSLSGLVSVLEDCETVVVHRLTVSLQRPSQVTVLVYLDLPHVSLLMVLPIYTSTCRFAF